MYVVPMYEVWRPQDKIGCDGEYPRLFISIFWGWAGVHWAVAAWESWGWLYILFIHTRGWECTLSGQGKAGKASKGQERGQGDQIDGAGKMSEIYYSGASIILYYVLVH